MKKPSEAKGKRKPYVKPDVTIVVLEPRNTLVDPCKCTAHTSRLGAVTWGGVGNDCFNSFWGRACSRYSQS